MYHLKKIPEIDMALSNPIVAEAADRTRKALADSSAGLEFEPVEHRYRYAGRELRSVSSIVEHFAPFDALAVATGCSCNPRHELYGVPPEEIRAMWEAAGREASAAGTRVHAFGEACFLYLTGKEDEIAPEYRDRVTSDGIAAVSPKEEALARWWAGQNWSHLHPVSKETMVMNPVLGYAGTFDLLLLDLSDGRLVQMDYKTNKDLERWYGSMLLPPLSMIRDNDIGKYTVQQTLYTIQIRNIGLDVKANRLVWLREDGYRVVELPLQYDRVIAYAVSQLRPLQ